MADHFSIDVYPEDLRLVAKRLGQMQDHLSTKGAKASATPGDIGDEWTGAAADAIKPEMSGLGSQMTTSATKFHESQAALTSLAQDYDSAQEQVVALNKKWAAADQAYGDAVAAAATAHDKATAAASKTTGQAGKMQRMEADDTQSGATNQASEVRAKAQHDLDYSFGMMKIWLAGQTRAAGSSLADAAPSPVTDAQINDWKNGRYPTRLSHPGLLASMSQAAAREEQQLQQEARDAAQRDVDALQKMEDQEPLDDPQAYQALLASIGSHANDPRYAKALVDILGVDGVNKVYDTINYTIAVNLSGDHNTQQDYLDPLKGFNDTLAAGLAQYDDQSFTQFVDDFAGPMGGPARLGMMAQSSYADDRLTGQATSYLDRMSEHDKYADGTNRRDIAADMLPVIAGGYDDLAKSFADRTDGATFHTYWKGLDGDHQDALIDRLLDDGQPSNLHGYDLDAKATVYGKLVDQAIDDAIASHDTSEVNKLLQAMTDNEKIQNVGYEQVLAEHLKDVFDNPAHLQFFAENVGSESYDIDPEMLAHIATDAFKGIDVSDLAAQVAGYAEGPERAAQDVGFLLSLADISETSVDYSGVVESLISLGLDKSGSPAAAAFGPLSELYHAMQDAEEKYGDFGEDWDKETQHQVLAFTVYATHSGHEIPGLDQVIAQNKDGFTAQQDSDGKNETDRYIHEWIREASNHQLGDAAYKAWTDMQQYQETIRINRDIGS